MAPDRVASEMASIAYLLGSVLQEREMRDFSLMLHCYAKENAGNPWGGFMAAMVEASIAASRGPESAATLAAFAKCFAAL